MVVAAWFLATFVVIALLRMRSPFELEWMEGGMVDHVRRVLDGHQLYGPPSLSFTPYLYTPLYSYVGAAFSWVLGVGYFPLRLLSLLASLAAMLVVGWWVFRETGQRWAGFVAAGLLAACYRIGGSWFDLARVDSLFLALLLEGLFLARFSRGRRRAALAAAVLVLAVLTKQEALLPALAPLPFLWRRDRGVAVTFAGTLAAGVGAAVLVLQVTSGGWFLYYVVEVPLAHKLLAEEVVRFWTRDLLRLAPATVVGVAGIALARRAGRDQEDGAAAHPDRLWFLVPAWIAMVGAAWSGRVHSGGFDNVLLPAMAMTAVILGIGLGELIRTPPAGAPSPAPGWLDPRWSAGLAAVLVLGQFALLVYRPATQLPPAADAERVDTLLADLRDLPGPVYLPGHGWYLARAGRTTGAQSAAIADVLRGPEGAGKTELRSDLAAMVRHQRFGSVVVDSDRTLSYLPADFSHYYCRSETLYRHGRLLPVAGTRTGPLTVWLPC